MIITKISYKCGGVSVLLASTSVLLSIMFFIKTMCWNTCKYVRFEVFGAKH